MKNLLYSLAILLVCSSCAKINSPGQEFSPEVSKQSQAAAINSFYVNAASGDNQNAGTSADAALKTIQAALNKTTNGAGSTIFVAGGTYHEQLSWPNSGASANEPITLTNYNNGVVILDGSNLPGTVQDAMILVDSKSYIRISNIRVANHIKAAAKGIHVLGSGTNLGISNCKIYNIGWNTNASSIPGPGDNANPLVVIGSTLASYNDVTVSDNEVYNCITGYSEALTLGGNVENFLIQGNTVHDITNIGIDMTGHYSWTGAPASVNFARNGNVKYNTVYRCISPVATSGGIYVDGGKSINIEGNVCYENYAGITVGCENDNNNAEDIHIRSNFIYNNIEAGILIGANQANSKVINASITNNTLYKNYAKTGWGGEIHMQNVDHLTVKNNIIQSLDRIVIIASAGYTSTNLDFNYNNYYTAAGTDNVQFDWGSINGGGYSSLAEFKAATGLDANSVYRLPGFISTSLPNPNLHLSNTSGSINAGWPSFVAAPNELDIDKEPRIKNSRVDIGADESAF
jgi:hypothetical protein